MNPLSGKIEFVLKEFGELSVHELYKIMRLRQAVFVVEQACVYQDADGKDLVCLHLLGRTPTGAIVSYLRILPPGQRYEEASMGRFLVDAAVRREGLGRQTALEGIRVTRERFPGTGIRVSGQAYLLRFYESLGFQTIGEPYLEDGIPHIEMYLPLVGPVDGAARV